MTPTSKQAGDGQDDASDGLHETAKPKDSKSLPQWMPYKGEYEKRWYDIKLKSGEVYSDCWPNAGFFHPAGYPDYIQQDLVAEVCEVDDPFWRGRADERVSDVVATDQEDIPEVVKSDPQSPPKDRDSLEALLQELVGAAVKYEVTGKLEDSQLIVYYIDLIKAWHHQQLKAAIRHLSTKEMLELIGPEKQWEWKPYSELNDVSDSGLNPSEFDFKVCTVCGEHEFHPESVHACEIKDTYRDELRAALTREENHDTN